MRVAIVDEELPYPPNSGKRIRTFELISRLARRHEITYISHRNADAAEAVEASRALTRLGIKTMVVEPRLAPRSGWRFYGKLALNLLSPLPYSVSSHKSLSLERSVREVATRDSIDLWQAEWTPYADYLTGLVKAPRLIMAHNVESQIWKRYFENEVNPFKRWYIGRQWRKFEAFERRVLGSVDKVVAVSNEDANVICDHCGARSVDIVENGVDTQYFQSVRADRDTKEMLFVGSLDWRPNLDAVDQLLSVVFPAVLAQEPSARLCLVGRNPPESLHHRIDNSPRVELHANVVDVRPFLARSALMVVPLRIGGGSRLKILEAFAAGLPVISTKVGAEGLEVRSGTHLTVVDSISEMACPIIANYREPQPAKAMSEHARLLVEDRYDWAMIATKLEAVWFSTMKANPVRDTAFVSL
jgi:glycosyltransferase involved in cell wall biosynthesis